jgi:CHAT domain-containing protein/Flp pilus assembly protein TadD
MLGARKWLYLSSIVLLGWLSGSTGCRRARSRTAPELYSQARLALRTGNLEQARSLADQGLTLSSSDPSYRWRFRLLKSEAVMLLGDTEQSLALLAGDPPGDPAQLAYLKMIEANDQRRLGNSHGAEALFAQAYALAKTANDPSLLAQVNLYIAGFHLRQKKYQQAEKELRESVAAADAAGDAYIATNAMDNLGVLKQNQLNFEEALYWFERVKKLAGETGARTSLAAVLGNHALCLEYLGDSDAALREMLEAAQEAAKVGIPEWQMDREQNIGNILLERGDFDGASLHYNKALEIARSHKNIPGEFDALTNLAELSVKRQSWDAGESYRTQAKGLLAQIGDPDADLEIDYLEGRVWAGKGRTQEAIGRLQSVAGDKIGDPQLILDTHMALAALLEQSGRLDDADREYRAAIQYMDASSTRLKVQDNQLSYLDRVNRFYRAYVDFLVRNAKADRALEVSDASRARLLTGGEGVRGATRSCRDFERAAAKLKATLLSYWVTPARTYLWVITADKVQLLPLGPGEDLRRLVAHYSNFIQQQGSPLTSDDPAGRELFSRLIAPVEARIPAGGRVIVIPDGPLHSLNFETLPVAAPAAHYWLEDATVTVSPSLGFLLEHSTRTRQAQDSLLVLGDPVSPGPDFPRLMHAANEVSSIARVFPAGQARVLENAQANPASYAQANPARYSLIHFVAHSLADSEIPLNSALILSPQNGAFKLSAREIAAIPIRARLVTLSACKGVGMKTYAGEGSVGLAWAFLHAGAEGVVASLWDVDDASTANIMADFYSRVKSGALPVDALRATKLDLIKRTGAYQKPYYWGVFQVYSGGQA